MAVTVLQSRTVRGLTNDLVTTLGTVVLDILSDGRVRFTAGGRTSTLDPSRAPEIAHLLASLIGGSNGAGGSTIASGVTLSWFGR